MTYENTGQPPACSHMRNMMRRLGYLGCSIKRVPDHPELFVVSACDSMDDKVVFCRTYTEEDMKCIAHASDIFWRYIK